MPINKPEFSCFSIECSCQSIVIEIDITVLLIGDNHLIVAVNYRNKIQTIYCSNTSITIGGVYAATTHFFLVSVCFLPDFFRYYKKRFIYIGFRGVAGSISRTSIMVFFGMAFGDGNLRGNGGSLFLGFGRSRRSFFRYIFRFRRVTRIVSIMSIMVIFDMAFGDGSLRGNGGSLFLRFWFHRLTIFCRHLFHIFFTTGSTEAFIIVVIPIGWIGFVVQHGRNAESTVSGSIIGFCGLPQLRRFIDFRSAVDIPVFIFNQTRFAQHTILR